MVLEVVVYNDVFLETFQQHSQGLKKLNAASKKYLGRLCGGILICLELLKAV